MGLSNIFSSRYGLSWLYSSTMHACIGMWSVWHGHATAGLCPADTFLSKYLVCPACELHRKYILIKQSDIYFNLCHDHKIKYGVVCCWIHSWHYKALCKQWRELENIFPIFCNPGCAKVASCFKVKLFAQNVILYN